MLDGRNFGPVIGIESNGQISSPRVEKSYVLSANIANFQVSWRHMSHRDMKTC